MLGSKHFYRFAFFALIVASFVAGSKAASAQDAYVSAGGGCLRLRHNANFNSGWKRCLKDTSVLKVLESRPNSRWMKVQTSAGIGFVFKKYVTDTKPVLTAKATQTRPTSPAPSPGPQVTRDPQPTPQASPQLNGPTPATRTPTRALPATRSTTEINPPITNARPPRAPPSPTPASASNNAPVDCSKFRNPENPAPKGFCECMDEIKVPYFDGKTVREGNIQINRDYKDKVLSIFKQLASDRYVISGIEPASNFGWNDNLSMQKGTLGNTSGYNYRKSAGGTESSHAWGTAIDLNPKCNPQTWYSPKTGKVIKRDPENAVYDESRPCTITRKTEMGRKVIKAFEDAGFTWMGEGLPGQPNNHDYQHFDVRPRPKADKDGYICKSRRPSNPQTAALAGAANNVAP